MTFVIFQSPLYPAALYTEADSNSSYLPVTLWMTKKDTPKGDLIYGYD